MILKIVKYGDPILKQVASHVEDFEEIKVLLENMRETMLENKGVGLAAPQVGKSLRAFVIGTPQASRSFVNPIIYKRFGGTCTREEGCLSIPGTRVVVNRPAKVKVTYKDENGVHRDETFEGLAARVIQHEFDHLEGKLIND